MQLEPRIDERSVIVIVSEDEWMMAVVDVGDSPQVKPQNSLHNQGFFSNVCLFCVGSVS